MTLNSSDLIDFMTAVPKYTAIARDISFQKLARVGSVATPQLFISELSASDLISQLLGVTHDALQQDVRLFDSAVSFVDFIEQPLPEN